MSFADLGLAPELLRAVAEKGYDTPTPIQSQAIPAVLSGRDVLAGAQTGTGKTAAFVLPILQKLGGPSPQRAPRAAVLTPTRELAAQIAENARTYGKYVGVRTAVVFGGVGINPQIEALRSGCDLLIATPGRLLDLQEQGALDLRGVQHFVLDEADRMLDMGFIHQIKQVFKLLPPLRQNLMFSATYSDDIRELASRFLRHPVEIEVAARNATADRVEQQVYRVPKEHKRHLLAHLIQDGNWHQVLVFTRTKHGANRLAEQLEHNGIRSAAIHGNKSQSARVRALADFKANKVIALVATEVAARGLDIKELPQVVNYELPNVPEDYVHRIGRTARAGGTGRAVSLVSPDEAPLLRDIERLLRRSLPVSALPQFPISAPPPRAPESERGAQQRERANGRQPDGRPQRRSPPARDSHSQRRQQGEQRLRPQQYSQPSPEEQRPWENPSHVAQPAHHRSHPDARRHSGSAHRAGPSGHSSSQGHSAAPGGAKRGATRSWRPRGRPGNWARHTGRPR
ncbi:MAG TPA: DEAD/DEAH box helicase [Steroidobacteraceae bacterium]|nr:DEAD/DEAH box helicase [Steroidobacteraceae bacterium]